MFSEHNLNFLILLYKFKHNSSCGDIQDVCLLLIKRRNSGFDQSDVLTHLTLKTKIFLYILALGLCLSRTSSAAILRYHFNDENIHFALSVSMMGIIPGLAVLPMAAEYAFTQYGFSKTMLLLVPLMSLHLLSGLTYVQTSREETSKEKEQVETSKEKEYTETSKEQMLMEQRSEEHMSAGSNNTEEKKELEENISENKEDARKKIFEKITMVLTNAKVYLQG